jgi:hypothetical protein
MTLLYVILIVLVLYFEWQLIRTALSPLIDIGVALFFILMLAVLIIVELALIVIAPAALFLGYESRDWHIRAARKIMFARDK